MVISTLNKAIPIVALLDNTLLIRTHEPPSIPFFRVRIPSLSLDAKPLRPKHRFTQTPEPQEALKAPKSFNPKSTFKRTRVSLSCSLCPINPKSPAGPKHPPLENPGLRPGSRRRKGFGWASKARRGLPKQRANVPSRLYGMVS